MIAVSVGVACAAPYAPFTIDSVTRVGVEVVEALRTGRGIRDRMI